MLIKFYFTRELFDWTPKFGSPDEGIWSARWLWFYVEVIRAGAKYDG